MDDEQENRYDCDDLPRIKVKNVTKWGCPAKNTESECSRNGSWWIQCGTWKNEECSQINKG